MADEDNLSIMEKLSLNSVKPDDLTDTKKAKKLFSEVDFTSVKQPVEKSEIDLYGTFFEHDRVKGDLHFVGSMKHLNLPMIKNSWLNNN